MNRNGPKVSIPVHLRAAPAWAVMALLAVVRRDADLRREGDAAEAIEGDLDLWRLIHVTRGSAPDAGPIAAWFEWTDRGADAVVKVAAPSERWHGEPLHVTYFNEGGIAYLSAVPGHWTPIPRPHATGSYGVAEWGAP